MIKALLFFLVRRYYTFTASPQKWIVDKTTVAILAKAGYTRATMRHHPANSTCASALKTSAFYTANEKSVAFLVETVVVLLGFT